MEVYIRKGAELPDAVPAKAATVKPVVAESAPAAVAAPVMQP